jgi:hypothetical protein
VREICTLCAMRQELETWPRENCEPTEQSKELDWKLSPYSAPVLDPTEVIASHLTNVCSTTNSSFGAEQSIGQA